MLCREMEQLIGDQNTCKEPRFLVPQIFLWWGKKNNNKKNIVLCNPCLKMPQLFDILPPFLMVQVATQAVWLLNFPFICVCCLLHHREAFVCWAWQEAASPFLGAGSGHDSSVYSTRIVIRSSDRSASHLLRNGFLFLCKNVCVKLEAGCGVH